MSGCGCKNKNNNNQQQAQPVKTQQEQNTASVKTAVQKIVEKYYNKK
jgi:hypothetical protein